MGSKNRINVSSDFLGQQKNLPDESLVSVCANILASQGFALSIRGKNFETLYVNDACLNLFDESREEWMEDNWEKRYQHGQVEVLYNDVIPTVLKGWKWRGELGIVTAKGEKKQVITDWDAIYNEQGEVVCFYGIYTDITKLKILKEELKRQNRFLNEIIDTLPDPLLLVDEKHRWVAVNKAFCLLVGKSREELQGKTDYDLFPDDEAAAICKCDDEAFKMGREIINEEMLTGGDGRSHLLSTKRVVVRGNDGEKILIRVGRDITKDRDLQKSMAETYRQLENGITALVYDLSRIQDDVIDSVSKAGAIGGLFEQCNNGFVELIKQTELKSSVDKNVKVTPAHLSPREYQVFLLLIQGKRIKDIAEHLGITSNTASTYRSRIMKKLGLSTMTDLVQYAMRYGLI